MSAVGRNHCYRCSSRLFSLGLLILAVVVQNSEVAEVGDRAGKEYGLEKTLNKMKARTKLRLATGPFFLHFAERPWEADWEPLQFLVREL